MWLDFRALTTGHPVVMGRRTWDSLPEPVPPAAGPAQRRRDAESATGTPTAPSEPASLDEALRPGRGRRDGVRDRRRRALRGRPAARRRARADRDRPGRRRRRGLPALGSRRVRGGGARAARVRGRDGARVRHLRAAPRCRERRARRHVAVGGIRPGSRASTRPGSTAAPSSPSMPSASTRSS